MRRLIVLGALCFASILDARNVVVFRAAGFPTVDAPAVDERAFAGYTVTSDLSGLTPADVLVLPYGSAFPLGAWPVIRDFLHNGGGLVVLGGAPFYQPVLRTPAGWELAPRQPTFAHDLLIGPADEVQAGALRVALPDRSWSLPVDGARRVWELTVRLATAPNIAGEHGAEGNREGVVRPLVHLVDARGIPRACPLVEIQRTRARWIFAASDAPLDAALVRAIVDRALEPLPALTASPLQASVNPGETPVIRVSERAALTVRDEAGREVFRTDGEGDVRIAKRLPPGLYRVGATAQGPRSAKRREPVFTAFWIRDDALLKRGPRFSATRDWLRRDGRVFPVIGTTYMASDVQRQFLFEPNPAAWDGDFAQMQKLGINFVRTGIWTGWSRAMDANGNPDETMLRSLEAYVQTAAKHDIVVTFTFFSFLPPSFGGTNPYLDPKSLAGQRNFVAGVARRFRGVGWIHYDLINEPSYARPEGLWSNRPIGDEWERQAWVKWVRARHGSDDVRLRADWEVAGDGLLDLPRQDELWPSQVREERHPRKVRDFVEFSHGVVAWWAAQLRDAIRAAAGDVLVTLGQDEGGTGMRPSQQLHADAVDYTCIHPWWQNDDVLANGVFVKVPEKPSLFQETGLMRLEDAGGNAWRTPQSAASLLGRKFASAFAARSTGAVEWAWNINPYMPIDNESTIGFFRPDGTAKAELDVVPRLAEFFAAAAPMLDDFEPDRVVVVIPQARLFMNRPAALDGTRRVVRTLAERFGLVPTALSDLRLTAERLRGAKLILVPSVELLDASAAEALLQASRAGARLLFTGAVTGDAYGRVPEAMKELGLTAGARPVQFREPWGTSVATFDAGLQESLLRATAGGASHEPLPLEYAREDAPLVALLESALRAAGVETQPSDDPVTARLLSAPRAVLAVVINDTGRDATRIVSVAGRTHDVHVAAGDFAMVLFDRSSGEVKVTTRPAR